MNPLISIIIPTWNRAEELKKSLSLCLQQTYKNIEIIISDDGSTDQTESIVKDFSDSRIVYLKNTNSGLPSVARNRALKIAKGEWIAFCDSDDYWDKEKLSIQLELSQKYHVDAVCSNAYLNNTRQTYFSTSSKKISTYDLLLSNKIICSSLLIKKVFLEKTGLFCESSSFKAIEDYLLWLKLSLFTSFYYTDLPLLSYTFESKNSIRWEAYSSSVTPPFIEDHKRYQLIRRTFLNFALEKKRYEVAMITSFVIIWANIKLSIKKLL